MSTKSSTTVLITGGNNGIGLAACQMFASQPNWHVIMGSRSLDKGHKAIESLKSGTDPSSKLSLVQLDITSDDSIAAAVDSVKGLLENNQRLDVLINNAGVCPVEFTRSTLREALETNATSPALVTKAFAPLFLRASTTHNASPPRLIYVSSSLGSIQRRTDPNDMAYAADYKAYRVSKAALNMVVVCDAWEYGDKIKAFAFCPGYVVTDLAGERETKEKAGIAQSPEGSAKGLLAIATGKRDDEAGKFIHGQEVGGVYPW